MRNKIKINKDDFNLYVTACIKSSMVGKIILSIFILALLIGYGIAMININLENLRQYLFPALIGGILILFFPLRYWLWNFFGKENLIINSKTLSYNYNYGLFQTNLKTINYDRIKIGIKNERIFEEEKYGTLVFFDYDKDTDVPIPLHETSIIINEEKYNIFRLELSDILKLDHQEKDSNIGFSIN